MPCVTLLRHKSAQCRTFKIGRGASRKECDAERRTIVESIVAHTTASECRAAR
ncbi:hypothetical protein KPSA1_06934 [Pseudomonas syringae pv. actinidiae]|uniref:Uncharacterized protein n=1 Tax=Pseudomonas syringae pv. actinidiae TaxID=103796 RepID=A0A2V0QT80_PSESF|nr:hypothetical protein KPSA1_06934 [Pseudomonas syringae pv. actinidiae]